MYKWFILATLLLLYALSYVDRHIIFMMSDLIKASLGMSEVEMSLILGPAFGVFYALFGFPIGWLTDRYPASRIVFCGVVAWSLCTSACGLAQSMAQLALARFGIGAGEASLSPASYKTISGIFPAHRVAIAIAIFSIGGMVGPMIAAFGGGLLVSAAVEGGTTTWPLVGRVEPWQQVFLLVGLPGIPLAFLAMLIPDLRTARRSDAPAAPFMPYLRERKGYFLLNLAGICCVTIMAYGWAAWLPSFLMRSFGISPAQVGLIVGLTSGLGGALGFLVAAAVSDRLFARGWNAAHMLPILFALPLIVASAVAAFVLVKDIAWVAVLLFLLNFLMGASNPVAAHFQITAPPEIRGRVAAVQVSTMHFTGLSLGPVIVASYTEYVFGDPAKIGLSMALIVASLAPPAFLFFFLGMRRGKRVPAWRPANA